MSHIPEWLMFDEEANPNVSFQMNQGSPASRTHVFKAIHVFAQHTASTPMPATVDYPGIGDPGVNVALPMCYHSLIGVIHLLACLTEHPSGLAAREGPAAELAVTVQGHDMFRVRF